jgi:hypothetical protein
MENGPSAEARLNTIFIKGFLVDMHGLSIHQITNKVTSGGEGGFMLYNSMYLSIATLLKSTFTCKAIFW